MVLVEGRPLFIVRGLYAWKCERDSSGKVFLNRGMVLNVCVRGLMHGNVKMRALEKWSLIEGWSLMFV